MSQEALILLCLKVTLVAGVLSVLAFVADYTRLAPWWKDEIGRTLVVKDILLILMLVPTILSLFFSFSRLTSYVAAWTDVSMFALLTPVMWWRILVWQRVHRRIAREASEAEAEKEVQP